MREALSEETAVPGKWFPYDGEPMDPDDVELMGHGGLGKRTRKKPKILHNRKQPKE